MAETMTLPHTLSEDEVRLRGQELGKVTSEAFAANEKRKDAGKAAKQHVDDLQKKMRDLARIVNSRTEYRETVVVWERDDGRSLMVCVRIDNGTTVQTRPMTEEELALRQVDLFDTDKRGAGKKDKAKKDADA